MEEVDWMDELTRKAALDKADSMAAHIAYPNEMLDNDKLTQFYTGVSQCCTFFQIIVSNLDMADEGL